MKRDTAFFEVAAAYEEFYESLQKEGELPYRITRSGMWAVSDLREVYRAFCHFHLDRYSHLADLGSGDGAVVLVASLFTRATGYEIDEVLYAKAKELRNKLNLTRAEFVQQDYFQADLSLHDLLYIYPDKPIYQMETTLSASWRGHLLVNGPHFPPRHFAKIAESPPEVGRFVMYELVEGKVHAVTP